MPAPDWKAHPYRAPFFVLAAAVALVYGRALLGQFVYDDLWVVVQNPALRSLRPLSYLADAQTYAAPGSGLAERVFRPLGVLSLALDYHAWGLLPWPYHLESILWHLLDSWLIFLLARRILRNVEAALLAACIFLVHPVQIESVAWITQRSSLLCVCGMLSALYFLGDGARSWRIGAGLVAYSAALLSKEEALVFLPLYWLWERFSRMPPLPSRARLKIYFPLVALTVVYAVMRSRSGHSWSQLEPAQHAARFLVNLQMASVCFAVYLGKIVAPMWLRVNYDYPLPINAWYLIGAEILAVSYIAAMVLTWLRGEKTLLLALLWLPLTLAPVLHFIPMLPFVAERFLYLGIGGVALGAGWLYQRFPKTRRVLCGWLLFLAVSAAVTVPHWKTPRSLWEAAVVAEPTNAYARACYAGSLDDPAEAERQFKMALTEHPSAGSRMRIMASLAMVCQAQGKLWQARYWAHGGSASMAAASISVVPVTLR